VLYQTNLTVTYLDFTTEKFLDVHPDNVYEIENGMLSFETTSGDEIIYVPADKILYFSTTCERVTANV
jgi:hypothetical protein